MKLLTHECPNCGAHLDIKEGKNRGKCEYCRVSFTIDSGNIKIEKPTEVTGDTLLKAAEASLYKFKDYAQSEKLFKKLIFRCAELPNTYIGLILSITHDFTLNTGSLFDISSISEYWTRYVILASDDEVSKYEDKYKKYCADFWLSKITSATTNFTDYTIEESNATLDSYFENYLINVDANQAHKIKDKLHIYKENRIKYLKKIKRIKILIIILVVCLALIGFIIFDIYHKIEKPKVKDNLVYTSEILNYYQCNGSYMCKDFSFLLEHFNTDSSKLSVSYATIDRTNSKIQFGVVLKNYKKEELFDYEFDIKDNVGPYIVDNRCSFYDSEDIDLNQCYDINTFNTGEVFDKSLSNINIENINFKEIGEKIIYVSYDYKGKEIGNYITVNIIKSDIEFHASINNTTIELNKETAVTYSIDKDIINKNIKFKYDNNFIKVNETRNTFTPINVGLTQICIYPEYDESKNICFDINISPVCKNTYIYNSDGVNPIKLIVGNDICPGVYKIYANVINEKNAYRIEIDTEKGYYYEYIDIRKDTSSINEEGQYFSFPNNYIINIPSGITQIKLVKK